MSNESVYLPGKIRDRIQDLMKSRKVTQAELATRIGCSESSLSRFISSSLSFCVSLGSPEVCTPHISTFPCMAASCVVILGNGASIPVPLQYSPEAPNHSLAVFHKFFTVERKRQRLSTAVFDRKTTFSRCFSGNGSQLTVT